LANKGIDQKFGGRAVNRAIQDQIEDLVSKKIINGEAKAGSKIIITEKDLNM
jgi:ATP-dependent Clp protease ATP-binding subunit ClpC